MHWFLLRVGRVLPRLLGTLAIAACLLSIATADEKVTWKDYAQQRLQQAQSNLADAESDYERWVALGDMSLWSVDAGAIEEARSYAAELLELSNKCKNDWNYGNAIHKANLTLGRIELRNKNIEEAKSYLLKAGKTPGSPQLDSFGPNMLLAMQLLRAGELEVVLEYFELCREFWELEAGQLDKWAQTIRNGEIPNFGPNLVY